MNKAQKEVQQAQLNDEKKVIKLLEKVYEQAKKDCEQKIRGLSARTDLENLQSIIYQKEYQQIMVDQIESILYDLHKGQFTTIADYLQQSYINGYVGMYYDLHLSGIPLVIPINQDQVVKAVRTDSKLSDSLYNRLGEDVGYLKRSIRAELSRGIASGSTWNEMALRIANGMNNPFRKAYNNAIRIARTEGHRIQNEAALDGQHEAKKKGADIVKQWDSTLDGRTRDEHRECDGQIIGIHNHPTNIPPTGSDFVAAGYRKYDFGIVVAHSGRVYKYKAGSKPFLPGMLDGRIDKYQNEPYNLSIEEAHTRALNEISKEYGIIWEELK